MQKRYFLYRFSVFIGVFLLRITLMIKIIVSWALWHNLRQLLIAVDQLLMTLYGLIISFFAPHKVYADETMSAYLYRHKHYWYANIFRRLVDLIFFIPNGFNFDHCQDSYVAEMTRSHLPPEFRK